MTTAAELVQLVQALGARLWAEEERLELDAPDDFPSSLVQLLRQYKAEVLNYLRQHSNKRQQNYRLKYPELKQPDDPELAEMVRCVNQQGYVLLWSTVLGDLIAFYKVGTGLRDILPGFVAYSDRKLQVLFREGGLLSAESLRLIHEAKKYGGRITDESRGNQP
jgi:hypothetical protein